MYKLLGNYLFNSNDPLFLLKPVVSKLFVTATPIKKSNLGPRFGNRWLKQYYSTQLFATYNF